MEYKVFCYYLNFYVKGKRCVTLCRISIGVGYDIFEMQTKSVNSVDLYIQVN